MHYHYVDIGTSNFDTSLDKRKKDEMILLVEPIFYYLQRLENVEGIIKAPFAVSDISGMGKMFYIPEIDIVRLGLPQFLKGCNPLNKKHELAYSYGAHLMQALTDPIITVRQLLKIYSITTIGELKIDTEGHDHVILKQLIECMKDDILSINCIQFECMPEHKNVSELMNYSNLLRLAGYKEIAVETGNMCFSL